MMNEHINGWLAAYFDGQLGERRTRKVEAHLKECEECRRELERLTSLRDLLQETPEASDLTAPERFVAQVGLRLQPRPSRPPLRRALFALWISVPLLILGIWAFSQTLFTLTGLTEWAFDAGLWSDFARLFPPAPQTNLLGVIPWHIGISLALGLVSLSWLASWWISQQGNLRHKKTE
jgi:predicted anti-sigma-YlaC factor YlaD